MRKYWQDLHDGVLRREDFEWASEFRESFILFKRVKPILEVCRAKSPHDYEFHNFPVKHDFLRNQRPIIGDKVYKVSGKPFKSGKKVNTVSSIGIHPKLNIPVFYFIEDDSYVECRRCIKT